MRNAGLPWAFALQLVLALSAKAEEVKDILPPASEGKTWKLIWHDEFDGDKLDGRHSG